MSTKEHDHPATDPYLADALFAAARFFATCPDEVLEPDTAVAMLETMAAHLQKVAPSTSSALKERAAKQAKNAASDEEREFFATVCDNFGL